MECTLHFYLKFNRKAKKGRLLLNVLMVSSEEQFCKCNQRYALNPGLEPSTLSGNVFTFLFIF